MSTSFKLCARAPFTIILGPSFNCHPSAFNSNNISLNSVAFQSLNL